MPQVKSNNKGKKDSSSSSNNNHAKSNIVASSSSLDSTNDLSAFWEWGSPDLPACGLRHGSRAAQHSPSSSARAQDPREGPSLAGWTTGSFLRHGLIRLAREEAERSRRGTSRGARDASHDDQGRQAAPARAVSSFPLWCKGSKRRREHQAKAPVSVQ